jgi:glucosamine-phosphate N-acetyltransferase
MKQMMKQPMFNKNLIDIGITNQVPNGFVLRPLEEGDYEKGYLDVLSQLTVVGNMSKGQFLERFHYQKRHNDTYFLIVVEDLQTKRIVGCGTLLLERKFIHQNGLVGHLEDVVTSSDYRGKQFGRIIIIALTSISQRLGSYKTILDCIDDNVAFYREKCGFVVKESQMVVRHPENDILKPKL